jgi:hypothetical protein
VNSIRNQIGQRIIADIAMDHVHQFCAMSGFCAGEEGLDALLGGEMLYDIVETPIFYENKIGSGWSLPLHYMLMPNVSNPDVNYFTPGCNSSGCLVSGIVNFTSECFISYDHMIP